MRNLGILWQQYGRWIGLALLLLVANLALLLVSKVSEAGLAFELWAYVLFDLMLLLPLWLLLGRLEHYQQQQQEIAALSAQLDALMQQAHLPLSQQDSLLGKLTILQQISRRRRAVSRKSAIWCGCRV